MSFDSNLNDLLSSLQRTSKINIEMIKKIISCIDLTLLDENSTVDDIKYVLEQADIHKVAAVCLYLHNYSALGNVKNSAPLATVVNFPGAETSIDQCLKEIDTALALGISEIDYVFPYTAYLGGSTQKALQHCQAIASACSEQHLKLKIILETGAFPDSASIYELSTQLIPFGCNFLKTSTGKITEGASLSMAFAILSAIKDTNAHCGIKVSGGVKTPIQAYAYAQLAQSVLNKQISADWFRIGASSLLHNLIQFKIPA